MPLTTLRLLLEEIKAGKTVFGPEGETDKDKDAFQYKADLLAIADQNGYIQGYYPIYSDNAAESLLDLILVEGLSPAGEQFLSGRVKACPDSY